MRIRTRLVAAFMLVALLPAVPLTLLVRGLLERSFGPGLDRTLEQGLEAGLAESRARLRERQRWLERDAAGSWTGTGGEGGETGAGVPTVWLPADTLSGVVGWTGRAGSAGSAPVRPAPPDLAARLAAGFRDQGGGNGAGAIPVDGYLVAEIPGGHGRGSLLARPLPTGMAERAGRLAEALSLQRLLRQERGAVLRGYVAPFLIVYGLLLAVAAAVGLAMARWLARPVEALSAAADRVAAGDLTVRVGGRGPGEIGRLVEAFDGMVGRLEKQRRELARLERIAAWRGMARTLAHEIKNPLTPILLAVQSARQSYRGEDEAHARVLADCEEIVGEEVEGLRGLVRRFADFARQPQPEPRPVDLAELLRDLARLYGEERLGCDAPAGGLPAVLDPDEIRRALINLVDNGLAACEEAGREPRVELAASREGDDLLVTVADRGAGIAPENLERIFEPDFTTREHGLGLGLPAVLAVVQGHGGSLEVDSRPGEGTTFTVRLPAAREERA